MIEISNFSKSYGSEQVYENFNLTLSDNEVTCILGASGSGKTTLLNAIAGLIKYEGNITLVKCSYVFQTPRLLPNLTVFENLKLVCKDEEKIYEMLEGVRLSDKAKSYPLKLSGGQAQRAAIARAFLYESDVILLDEPFFSLDIKLKEEISELFYDLLKKDGRTAVYVTHDVYEAAKAGQRFIIIDKGTIIFDKRYEDALPRTAEREEEIRGELRSTLLR